jgi:SAM-dependent methyltransferase
MLIRPIDIVRRPRRTLAYARREAGWLRRFARTIEDRGVPAFPPPTTEATDRLHAALTPSAVTEVAARLEGEDAARWQAARDDDRKRLELAFGLHYGVDGVAQRTRLSPADPPESVHAMGRGSVSTGGSYYYADLVVDALRGAGADLASGRGLDFGCSSGRVVRVLATAFPELEWHGCDPQPTPIAWAREHLPGIEFRVSPEHPPLPYGDGSFDFAFAISIWSHYGERAARSWLTEMHRIVRPGGHLLLTFHGFMSIAYYVAHGGHTRRESVKIAGELYRDGYWFDRPWTADGDHGIRNPEWGTAFFTTEWLLNEVVGRWSVVGYGPGRAEGNQDMVVLQRR